MKKKNKTELCEICGTILVKENESIYKDICATCAEKENYKDTIEQIGMDDPYWDYLVEDDI